MTYVEVAHAVPLGVNDCAPFEAPVGYAPSGLVFEELASFGPCSHIRGGSRLDLSPFPRASGKSLETKP